MLIHSITFQDEETGELIEVKMSEGEVISHAGSITHDKYLTALFHAQKLIANSFQNHCESLKK